MLISQRIAKDLSFLKLTINYKGRQDDLFKIRFNVINSMKFIVGHELFDAGVDSKEFTDRLFEDKKNEAEAKARLDLYSKKCRLPFPVIVIENDTGLLLIIQKNPSCWNVYNVRSNGQVCSAFLTIQFPSDDSEIGLFVEYFMSEETIVKLYGYEQTVNFKQALATNLGILFVAVMEILLFMNAQNIKHVKYVLTKKENAPVAKVLQPKYTYHILDLFKQKKVYTSLEDIKDDLCKSRPASLLRRAVLVRGHFKQRKTGLFFWDFHTRNKHNAETHGVVDKDYRVHDPIKGAAQI